MTTGRTERMPNDLNERMLEFITKMLPAFSDEALTRLLALVEQEVNSR